MAARKVVQDSDDESNEAGSPPPPEDEPLQLSLDTIIDLPSSSPPKIMQQSEQPSTSSTDRLSRELREAHKNLLEPTPESNPSTTRSRHSSEQPSLSPQWTKSQGRRATVSSLRGKEKKQQKKYGKSTRDRDNIYEHSEDELGRSSLSYESGKHDHVDGEAQDEQSPLEDSAAASRVNAMLDSYGAAETPVLDTGGFGGHFRVETSIQKVSTPAVVIGARSQQSNPSTWPTIPNTTPTKPTSTDLSGGNSFGTNDFLNYTNEESVVADHQVSPQNQCSNDLDDKPTSSTKDDSGQVDAQNELSFPPAGSSKTDPQRSLQKQQARVLPAVDELSSDGPAIDLPEDQYQPRPSRSRGTHNEKDLLIPENFSKRPEDLVKGKRKARNRRKTTALEKPTPKVELDEEDEEEAKMPTTAIPKLWPRLKGQKKNPGQAAAVDQQWEQYWAKEEEMKAKQAQADPSPKKRGRGRPKKQDTQPVETIDDQERDKVLEVIQDAAKIPSVQEDGNKRDLPTDEAPAEQDLDENSADDEEPTKRSRKRKANTMPAPSDDEDDEHTEAPAPEEATPTVPKPRGRKKRKTDEATAPADSDHETTVTDAPQSTKAPPKKRGRKKKSELAPVILPDENDENPLQPGNDAEPTDPPPKILSQSKGSNTNVPPPPVSPAKLTTPPTTPPKTAKPVHSPLNSSQVKFRVGLSKRARIAPLLKIVRK
ncbi:hypothetical protein G7Y79_00014g036200 [Physcia stellaris]|nr:hypothetical protein G7Y79_00014g036200 [Physcia stellaris]